MGNKTNQEISKDGRPEEALLVSTTSVIIYNAAASFIGLPLLEKRRRSSFVLTGVFEGNAEWEK